MNRKGFLLISLLLCFVVGMNAQRRAQGEMRRIAAQKLGDEAIDLLDTYSHLRVYGNGNGFVIVNSNSNSKPVIGYSKAKYDKNRLPDGLKWWLKVAEANALVDTGMTEPISRRASFTAVTPFITSEWDQEKPYYYQCPKDGSNFCMTGCVATALSQVLYYYQYPASAKGDGMYTLNNKDYNKSISTTYDWANMKDTYGAADGQFSSAVKAVSTLMRDCGYATHMSYSADGSGTSDIYIAHALRNVFKYDSLAIKYYDRSYYADEEWKGLIYSALAKKMPVMYAGADEDGSNGHEFLFCGVDADGLVYVNWGWGGDGNGYFDLDMLKYRVYMFNHYQSMVVGTKPQESPDADDKFESVWIGDAVDYAVQDNDVLQMNLMYLFNYSILDFNGTIDLTLVNKANASDVHHMNIINTHEEGYGRVQPFYGYYFTDEKTEEVDPIYMDGFKDLSAGIYRMYLTSKEDRDTERQAVRGSVGGVQYATLKKLPDGTLLVSNEDVDDISTGIQEVPNVKKSRTAVYNLNGHKVSPKAMSSKGIYIVNNQKVISR